MYFSWMFDCIQSNTQQQSQRLMDSSQIPNSYIERCGQQKLQNLKQLAEIGSSNIFRQIISSFNPKYHEIEKSLIDRFNAEQKIDYDKIYMCNQNGLHYYPYYPDRDVPLLIDIANHYMRIKQNIQDQKIRIYEKCIIMYQLAISELEKTQSKNFSILQKKEKSSKNKSTIFIDEAKDMEDKIVDLKNQLVRKEKQIEELQAKLIHNPAAEASLKTLSNFQEQFNEYKKSMEGQVAKLKSIINNRQPQVANLKKLNSQLLQNASYLDSTNRQLKEKAEKGEMTIKSLQSSLIKYKNLLTQKDLSYDYLIKQKQRMVKELDFLNKNMDNSNIVYVLQKPQNVIELEEHIKVLTHVLIKKEEEVRNQQDVKRMIQVVKETAQREAEQRARLQKEKMEREAEERARVQKKKMEREAEERAKADEANAIHQRNFNELSDVLQKLNEADNELAAAFHKMKNIKAEANVWREKYEEEVKRSQCLEIDAAMNQKAIDLEKEVKRNIQKLIYDINNNAKKQQANNIQFTKARITLLEKQNNEKDKALQLLKNQLDQKDKEGDLHIKRIQKIQRELKQEKGQNTKLALKIKEKDETINKLQQRVNLLNEEKQDLEKASQKKLGELNAFIESREKQVAHKLLEQVASELNTTCNSIEDLKSVISRSNSTLLTVSPIFEARAKERKCLIDLIESNTKRNLAKSELLFKYDTHHRSFIPYLTQRNFPFVLIFKLELTGNIMGVFTFGFDPEPLLQKQTFLFSLKDSGASFGRDPNSNVQTPVVINSNYLYFGSNELSIKNNNTNEFSLTLNIYGSKYFKSSDEYYLIGEGNKNAVKFSEMEVHRLHFK